MTESPQYKLLFWIYKKNNNNCLIRIVVCKKYVYCSIMYIEIADNYLAFKIGPFYPLPFCWKKGLRKLCLDQFWLIFYRRNRGDFIMGRVALMLYRELIIFSAVANDECGGAGYPHGRGEGGWMKGCLSIFLFTVYLCTVWCIQMGTVLAGMSSLAAITRHFGMNENAN